MVKMIFKKVFIVFFQLFFISIIVFSALRLMPGDPAVLALGTERGADPEAVAAMRETLGLNEPIISQYINWIGNIITLDFGESIFDGSSVTTYISERFPKTIELVITSVVLATLIGVPMGILAAIKRGGFIDTLVSSIAALGISFPVYIIGTFLIFLFSFQFKLLPASGYVPFVDNPVEFLKRLLLPALTIALGLASTIARMTRASMLEVLNKDFIQTLRAKGLNEKTVLFKHALKNSIISVITVVGLEIGGLIGGTVLIEYLFNWPGMSSLLVNSINDRDYPIIQSTILVIAGFYIIINFIVEILYGILDPRTRQNNQI